MRSYESAMTEVVEAEIDSWPLHTTFPIHTRMQAVTLEVILRVVFGVSTGPRLDRLREMLGDVLQETAAPGRQVLGIAMQRFGGNGPFARFEGQLKEVDELLFAEIARRRREPDGTDVLSMLLQADEPPSDAELRDHLITLLLAGHETTATTLAWTFERLVRHPEALARASTGDEAYIDAVVQESQRLRPVITYVMRTLQAPMTVGGHEVPAGATLGTSITLMHRRADLYPQPLAFRPERFLEAKPETYTWVPFGGGVRRCLGAAFASFEMRQVLDVVLSSRRLTAADPRPERYRRRGITFVPGRGASVVAQPL
jgi:cytochrome P450 family 135